MVYSIYISLLTYDIRYICDTGFVKGLLMIGILLLVPPIYNAVIFASFFNCLMTGRMNFGQNNIKLLNTCFIYGILYIFILQPTVHVLTQVFIRMPNVCSFTGWIIDFMQKLLLTFTKRYFVDTKISSSKAN
jgi:hypothetical protein